MTSEIEIPLEKHHKIAEVAVEGAPHAVLGGRVRACIILKERDSMTGDEVRTYLQDNIAKYKMPEIVILWMHFPGIPPARS